MSKMRDAISPAISRDVQAASAHRFLVASVLITAMLFGFINVVVHFAEPSRAAPAPVAVATQAKAPANAR